MTVRFHDTTNFSWLSHPGVTPLTCRALNLICYFEVDRVASKTLRIAAITTSGRSICTYRVLPVATTRLPFAERRASSSCI